MHCSPTLATNVFLNLYPILTFSRESGVNFLLVSDGIGAGWHAVCWNMNILPQMCSACLSSNDKEKLLIDLQNLHIPIPVNNPAVVITESAHADFFESCCCCVVATSDVDCRPVLDSQEELFHLLSICLICLSKHKSWASPLLVFNQFLSQGCFSSQYCPRCKLPDDPARLKGWILVNSGRLIDTGSDEFHLIEG